MWIYCLNTRQLGCCHSRGETQLNLFHIIFLVHHFYVKIKVNEVQVWPFGGVCRSNYNMSVELISLSWQTCSCQAALTGGLQMKAMNRCYVKGANWILASAKVNWCLRVTVFTPLTCVQDDSFKVFLCPRKKLTPACCSLESEKRPAPKCSTCPGTSATPSLRRSSNGTSSSSLTSIHPSSDVSLGRDLQAQTLSDDRQPYCCKIPP